jgi:hypothetical protein
LLSSFEWDVKLIFLVPGAWVNASGKQNTTSKWDTWVACNELLQRATFLPVQRGADLARLIPRVKGAQSEWRRL